MSASRVAGIVVNWSTPDDLVKMITSAEHVDPGMDWYVTQHPHETIDSTKAIRSLENMLGVDRIKTIYTKRNEGHGKGINMSAQLAMRVGYPYLFLLNPDTEFVVPIVNSLTAFLDEYGDAIAVGPKQLDSQHRITAGGIIGTNEEPKHRSFHVKDAENRLHRDTVKCPMIAGSAMMVRAEPFWGLGGLLASRHYYSETWFCYHARAHGWDTWYYGEPWMIHEWHQSSPVGHPGTDGKFKEDQQLFRRMCDEHEPRIARD